MSLFLNQSNTLGSSAGLNQKEPHVWVTKVYVSKKKKKKSQFPVQNKNTGKRPQQKDKKKRELHQKDSSRSGKNQLTIRQTSLGIGITLGSFHYPGSKLEAEGSQSTNLGVLYY